MGLLCLGSSGGRGLGGLTSGDGVKGRRTRTARTRRQYAPCRPSRASCGAGTLPSLSVSAPRYVTFYWQLETYRTRAAADEAKGPRGTVVERVVRPLSVPPAL